MASKALSAIPPSVFHLAQQTGHTLDHSANRLSAILQSSAGVDKFLLTIYYTLKLLYPQISRIRALRLQHHLSDFLTKANSALLPGESLVAILQLSKTDSWLAETDKSLRLAAAMISEFRMISRLWGLLTMYRWAKGTYIAPPRDGLVRALTWGQIAVLTGYQALENVAYLAGKGILRGELVSPERQKQMWLVSCRLWLAHTIMEAVRLLRTRQLAQGAVVGEEKAEKVKRKEEVSAWKRAWYANAAYSPMALHYSLPDGLLSDDVIGALGVIVGFHSFGHLWKQTT